ncbi:MAG: hypothetical protein QOD30_1251, partial [Actinomycetota bacterium]|nr:hypothetical protein [Actinomycetota bacterium]
MTRVRRASVLLSLFVVAVTTLAARPTTAHAQTVGEHITRYDFAATVEDDGDLAVHEAIEYDFGAEEHHGIFRDIPTRLRYDDRNDRVYPLRDVHVTSPDAPTGVKRESGPGGTTRLRIGDPDRTISGVHQYVIEYTLAGGLNAFSDHVELYWNAIGTEWTIPIERVTATVRAPTPITRSTCFAGPAQSANPCEETSVDGSSARFSEASLAPGEALTFVVALPNGSVTATGPVLEERWSPSRAFERSTSAVAGAVSILAIVLVGIGTLAWRVGRDRRAVGGVVDAAFAGAGATEERVPLFEGREVPVEFVPPDKLRPGQLGTLVDERANPLDVTATIVDLAVRGFLRIEEIEKAHWFSKGDWRLVKLKSNDGLLHYEQLLFDAIFEGDDTVELSDLKNKFAAKLHKVQDALYEDAVERRWFSGRPDRVRAAWVGIGIVVTVVGVGLTVLLASQTHLGLVPTPIILGGIALLALSGRMPRRTAQGRGVLVRALGFKRFIDESEKDRARFAEQQHLFTEYLPYAVVFGATEQWAKAFAGLDGQLPDQS